MSHRRPDSRLSPLVSELSAGFGYIAAMTRALFAILVILAPHALAQDSPSDHGWAEAAVARGAILPLAEVLENLARTYPGRVIEVEIDEDDGLIVYEIAVVTEGGRLLDVEVNAATGAVLDVEFDDDD